MYRLLPSITTHSEHVAASSWESKIVEVQQLKLSQVGLFLTGLNPKERQRCFTELECAQRSHFFTIPFVHAVTSMHEREYWYLKEQFYTEYFNLHPVREYPLQHELSARLRRFIYIENATLGKGITIADIKGFAGICFDLSHLDDSRRASLTLYQNELNVMKSYCVGANHVSAVGERLDDRSGKMKTRSRHFAMGAYEFAYLRDLNPEAFAHLMAIEVDNSLTEQLEFSPTIIKYLDSARIKEQALAA